MVKILSAILLVLLVTYLRQLRDKRYEVEHIKQKQLSAFNASQAKKRKRNKITSLSKSSIKKKSANKLKGEFAAVSVRFTPNACEAVKQLQGQRFLSKDAPLMPLQECPRRNICNCFYDYHEDRRENDERSDFNVAFGILPNYDEDENKHRRWYDHEVKKVS